MKNNTIAQETWSELDLEQLSAVTGGDSGDAGLGSENRPGIPPGQINPDDGVVSWTWQDTGETVIIAIL